ncbi:MAG: UDP-N-acetylmuramyl pentapeptide phosphotransferase/UDP-N-acetylglucosamine-1-phosphate transferase [Candidatus Falkowbacteria bacterium GW2011_GWA2_39_24]|uniref:UDP-N-acetylmuramyl pentapeptide phosphotransferase/UDP-N-acetylglucosamine-1-phosphate transferase n=1 Tax=Candidatus Falkowbacteria bacterium GW2011_GWA2_39_24 TaxID=1618634 RepID=A0A0G0QTL5_9BACT|nr:MAG: UDP-N-acetylmuramyl pentapeptide phosphotransferase/UDP-N-acetylglucosamine-1-phosphate transferase [Candidatus Falkowbacteria bacterium GW2011_GWA2_39_24]
MIYVLAGLSALCLAWLLTRLVRQLAFKWGVVDLPNSQRELPLARKIHSQTTPLLGGVAIFLTVVTILLLLKEYLVVGDLAYHHWLGVLVGAIIVVIGGVLDDKYNLAPKYQVIFPILACLAVVAGGVGIAKVSNPFGGLLFLNEIQFPVLAWGGQMHYFVLLADVFTILWLMGMMYTTKLLDGLDGLVAGVAGIGSLIIFLFTMTTRYFQPDVGLAALIVAAACAGYLILAWHPAKIFLGESGSLFLGFVLGVLSIISGGKIAIALLIMGIPILDVLWTIIRRLRQGHNPFAHADRQHLHFRLMDAGLGTRKTVLIYYALATIFGLSALFLQSRGKLLALIILGLIMLALLASFAWLDKKAKTT